MSLFDLDLEELRDYRANTAEPADFDDFWAGSLAGSDGGAAISRLDLLDAGLATTEVFDVRFRGWADEPVAAWFLRPRGGGDDLPVVVEFAGYGAGRGHPYDRLLFSAAGYAHLVVDTRGQGSTINHIGATADHPGEIGPHVGGFLTMGVESPQTYYYRRLYVDAARALGAARELPGVDPDRVVAAGMSQGGGLAIAAAGLGQRFSRPVTALLADVPFLSHFRRAATITDARPYAEISMYAAAHRDRIGSLFTTLDYFDGIFLAARSTAPALFSVALMDQVCPPSTVFAAFNACAATEKRIEVYPFNGHDGGGAHHRQVQLDFLAELLT